MRTYIMALVTSLVLALVGSLPVPSQAQVPPQAQVDPALGKPIGKVVTVTGSVTIEHGTAVLVQANISSPADQPKEGDPVFRGDVVRTGADGRLGINFADGTSFNLSSNAQMALSEFVYDPTGSSNATLFNLSKGTFTFVAGKVAKTGAMRVDTPVATMGIRGTTPHVEVSDDGTVKFSTLVEEGKSKLVKRSASPTAQPEQRTDRKVDLNICRGC